MAVPAFGLRYLDRHLMDARPRAGLAGLPRFLIEFLYFGLKEARACLFAGLFFAAIFLMPQPGLFGVARYDLLLLVAIVIQAWMLAAGLETRDELKAILVFHLLGFALEVFKTSAMIDSWAYPGAGYTKVLGVPLFSGFMYAAVGSYIIQAWRLLDLRVVHHPPYGLSALISLAIYINFFSHHFVGDYRSLITAVAVGLYARTRVIFVPMDRARRMPLLLAFVLIGFFLWLAENIGTLFSLWQYPNQLGAWSVVHLGKWHAWSLLIVMTFTIVANLKHVKTRIHVPD